MQLEIPRLPVDFMNADHDHAARQLDALYTALPAYPDDAAALALACRTFAEHSREHFAREEAAMLASGFPPYPVHRQEHERVLAWLAELTEGIATGSADPAAVALAVNHDIPVWLIQHIQTMDWATANWIASH